MNGRLAGLLLTSLLVGCSDSEFDIVPVSGRITLDGEPLAGGVVNFQPRATANSDTAGPGSSARIADDGSFSLTTVRDGPGAVVGVHRVKIYSYSPESPIASDSDAGPSKERVPDWYNYRSKLEFEVSPEGNEAADFELTTTPG